MGRNKKIHINNIGCYDDENTDVCGFGDADNIEGNCISSFSFNDSENNEEVNLQKDENNIDSKHDLQIEEASNAENISNNKNDISNINETNTNNNEIFDNRRTPIANGAAPAIDGETPSIRRCYVLRESTIRKINELKILDNDINVCVSTIVDLAIDYYHKLITEKHK